MSKKDLVKLIKKTAQGLADPPGVDMKSYNPVAPSPPPPNLPPPPPPPIGSRPAGEVSSEVTPASTYAPPRDIVRMQTELINLAKTVTNEIGTASPTVPKDAKDPEVAGRLAFSNFITEHYVRQSDVPAVEYDPNPQVTDVSKKRPAKARHMNVVMDTMSRVGGPQSEFKTDGKWGSRTNAALRNAYALAFALLKMAKDFKLNPRTYSQSDLERFKNLIPLHDNVVSFTDKVSRAKEIIPQLRAIRNLFAEVKEHILQKPAYRSYIEGDQAYTTYKPKNVGQWTSQQLQSIKQSFPNGFQVPLDQKGSITTQFSVDDISTLDSLNKRIRQEEQTNKVKLDPYNVLTLISDQVSSQMNKGG